MSKQMYPRVRTTKRIIALITARFSIFKNTPITNCTTFPKLCHIFRFAIAAFLSRSRPKNVCKIAGGYIALPHHPNLRFPDRVSRGEQRNRSEQHDIIDESGLGVESVEHDGPEREDLCEERHSAAAATTESSRGELTEQQRDCA